MLRSQPITTSEIGSGSSGSVTRASISGVRAVAAIRAAMRPARCTGSAHGPAASNHSAGTGFEPFTMSADDRRSSRTVAPASSRNCTTSVSPKARSGTSSSAVNASRRPGARRRTASPSSSGS